MDPEKLIEDYMAFQFHKGAIRTFIKSINCKEESISIP